jgi:DNA gyrase inhibitor GyrI
MGVLLERKAQVIFVTASSVEQNGKAREVIVESRPQYAVVQLNGSKEKYPIAWEMIYELAKERHAENLRLEALAQSQRGRIRRKRTLK